MNPYMHHIAVFAEWALRRPMSSALGVTVLTVAGLLVSLASDEDGVIDALGGVFPAMVFAAAVAIFGLIAGASCGPTRGGSRLIGHPAAMPALPLRPTWRTAGELTGVLLVWVPGTLLLCWFGTRLPATPDTFAGMLQELSDRVAINLDVATLIVLPSLAIGRRAASAGTPTAFGPMLLAWLVTLPLAPLVVVSRAALHASAT